MTEQHPDADAAGRSSGAESEARREPETFLRLLGWPPPGLARVQGDLGMVVRKTVTAASVLVMPLLFVLTVDQPQPGLGPLGSSWWIALVTTLLGLFLLLDALVSLWRVLRRAVRALEQGYSGYLVGQVLADVTRDGGFLMQGAQVYSMMDSDERRRVGHLRLWAQLAYLGTGLWMVVGFGVLLILGARGVVTPQETALWTMAPAASLIVVGIVLRAWDGTLVRRARKAWFRQPWVADLALSDAEEWREAALRRGVPVQAGPAAGALPLRLAMGVVLVAGVLAALPPVTLVPSSSVGAILGMMSPSLTRVLENTAATEAYRVYRLDADPSVTAEEAGELLNTLFYAGGELGPREGMKGPAQTLDTPWLPDAPVAEWQADQPAFWGGTVWDLVEAGSSRELRAYLRLVADHPGHALFSRLARAGEADVFGARYVTPFPQDWRSWNVPFPRYGGLQTGARAHLGIAALHAADGRPDQALVAVREVISVGFLLMEESPQLIDHAIGHRFVEMAGDALHRLLPLTGRTAASDELAARVAAAEAATTTMALAGDGLWRGPEGYWRGVQIAASAEIAPRALRWHHLSVVSDVAPCMNLQRVVFGPGQDYQEWIDGMRARLVRYPSEEAFFDLTLRGFAGSIQPTLVTRILGIAMGGAGSSGSCAQVLGGISQL